MPPRIIDAFAAVPPAGLNCARSVRPPDEIRATPIVSDFTVGDAVAVDDPP